MPRPTARVLALLEILQAGGTHTASDLAARLEVDERTVRRYVDHLIELDIPVWSERGRYGGFRLGPGYRMPPLMLTDDEALAVVFGLVAGRRGGRATPVAAMESALAKVRRVLPDVLSERLNALLETVQFTAPARPGVTPESDTLLVVAEATRNRQPVTITYKGWNGQPSERTLRPYGMVVHAGRWYVTGADSASHQVRNFRMDRIASAEMMAGTFEVPPGFEPAARVLAGLAAIPYSHEVSFLIQAPPNYLDSRLPAGIATAEELPDGEAPTGSRDGAVETGVSWFRVQLRAERLDWVSSVIAWIDRPFVIEQPDALREEVTALARRLVADAANGRRPR